MPAHRKHKNKAKRKATASFAGKMAGSMLDIGVTLGAAGKGSKAARAVGYSKKK